MDFQFWDKAVLAGLLLGLVIAAQGRAQPVVDHTPFDSLLRRHVSQGGVDYGGFKADVAQLDRYLASLAVADLDAATRQQKLAFFINAYNACTIRLILRHHGNIGSIRDIKKPFKTREWKIAGRIMSLDEIENDKLRAELAEPRIHFAIVCASVSCPDLASHAYTAAGIDRELDEAAGKFLGSKKHLRVEVDEGFFSDSYILYVSQIFNWFEKDFTRDGQRVADFVARHAGETTAAFIRKHRSKLVIRHLDYDWSLNQKSSPDD